MSGGYLSAIFNVVVALGIPVAVLVYLLLLKRKHLLPFLVGAVAFAVSQVLIRLPILNWLAGTKWFIPFAQNNNLIYVILLSLSAGLFEEGARWLCMRFVLRRPLSRASGIFFGIGHGGFEAVYILGIPMLSALINQPLLLRISPPIAIYPGGIERILAIALHVGLSLIVLHSVKSQKPIWLVIAILLHGFANAATVLVLQNTKSIFYTELTLAIITIFILLFAFWLTSAYKEKKHNEIEKTPKTN